MAVYKWSSVSAGYSNAFTLKRDAFLKQDRGTIFLGSPLAIRNKVHHVLICVIA